jgi:mobilome CxxCx(11)CxxC protein
VETRDEELDRLKVQGWEAALHAYGTGHIFQKRAHRLKRRTDLLNMITFAVPVLIGTLVGTFGQNKLWSVVVIVAAVVGAAQVVISLWALVTRWPEDLAYSSASAAANESLSARFASLARDSTKVSPLRTQLEKLSIEDASRRERDNEKGVKDKERRMGMRAALRKFQRTCPACNTVPTTMDSSDCGVCGRF